MGSIAELLNEDLKAAVRAKDTTALNALHAVKSAVTNAAIGKGGADAVLDDAEAVEVIRKQIKQLP